MNKLLSLFSDGSDGMPLSLTRFLVFVLVAAVIGTKFYNSGLTGQPIVWNNEDFSMLGIAFGAKLWQNSQEQTPPVPKTP